MKIARSRLASVLFLALPLACVLALSGCGTTRVLQPVSAAGGDNALVYFIRKDYPPYIYAVRLIVNGSTLATLSNNDFVAVNVPVGRNSILVDVTDGKKLEFDLQVEEANTRYIVLTGEVTNEGQKVDYEGVTVFLNWKLWAYPVERSEAEAITTEFRRRIQ